MIEVNVENDKSTRNSGEDIRKTRKLETEWCMYVWRDLGGSNYKHPGFAGVKMMIWVAAGDGARVKSKTRLTRVLLSRAKQLYS